MLRVVLFLVLCLLIAPDRSETVREQFIVGSTPIPAAPVIAAIPTDAQFEEMAKTDVFVRTFN